MAERYPEIEPYAHGMLGVGDGQSVYWEQCGNPAGKPAVVLHGGPGSGCIPSFRRIFNPEAYLIVLLDQELLREHLGIGQWLVWGISWGSTLGLAYAQTHPERVSEIVLASVTMTRPMDIDWLYHGVGRFFPEEWRRFRDGAGPAGARLVPVGGRGRVAGGPRAEPALRRPSLPHVLRPGGDPLLPSPRLAR